MSRLGWLRWPTGRVEMLLRWGVAFALSVAAAGLVGLAIVAFVSSQETTKQALDTRDQTAASASKRITGLQADLKAARADLETAEAQRGELIAKVDALALQVAALGAKPVAVSSSSPQVATTTTTTTRRRQPTSSATTTTSQPPTTTTTTPPPTTTTTSPPPGQPTLPCRVLPLLCPNGARHR